MEILYIILGWLFGLLSPAIIKKISEGREKNNLKKIIFHDLEDLKKRLSPLPYLVYPRYGKLDKEKLEWLKKNSDIGFSDGIKKMTSDGVDLETIIKNFNATGLQKNTHSHFKKMHLSVIDSHLTNLSLVDSVLISKVLEIKFHVEAINEDIDNFREHLRMTFQPGITDGNFRIISQELENISLDIGKKSMYIVDKINTVLEN